MSNESVGFEKNYGVYCLLRMGRKWEPASVEIEKIVALADGGITMKSTQGTCFEISNGCTM